MGDFRKCDKCNQIVPVLDHDCGGGSYQYLAAGDSQAAQQPDPRDQRIAELEAVWKETWEREHRFYGMERRRADRLAAEVERLKARLSERGLGRALLAKDAQLATARRALEVIRDGCPETVPACRVAREALAAMDASGAPTPPAAGSPDLTAQKLARAVDILRRWSVRDARTFLAEPPTAGEREYAALLRVAEAAERMCEGSLVDVNGKIRTDAFQRRDALGDALADLRRARGNVGSDG